MGNERRWLMGPAVLTAALAFAGCSSGSSADGPAPEVSVSSTDGSRLWWAKAVNCPTVGRLMCLPQTGLRCRVWSIPGIRLLRLHLGPGGQGCW